MVSEWAPGSGLVPGLLSGMYWVPAKWNQVPEWAPECVLVPAKWDWIRNWAPECVFVPAEWNCDYLEQSWLEE